MRGFRFGLTSWGVLVGRIAPTLVLCLALLGGCRFGDPGSFFSEDGAIESAVASLKDSLGSPVRVLNVVIGPDRIVMRVQDPANRARVDEWRLDRMRMMVINFNRISGPLPYQLTLVNPDLEANLFELREVDFTAALALARAAIDQAALSDKARVTQMEIARQQILLPSPASGEIRWTVDVNSAREAVQIFADARGTIVGKNIDGTDRAKNLDIFRQLDLVGSAAGAFRFIIGPDQILTRVSVTPHAIGFETSVADPAPAVPVSGSLSARRAYNWTLNGLQRALAVINADAAFGQSRLAFSVDDVDWTILPRLAANAPAQLSMPQGHLTGIEVARPVNPLGPAVVLWKIQITDPNKESGYVLADTAGNVKQVLLPQSQRKVIDYCDPATMADTFKKLAVDFGQDRQYAEITFLCSKVMITAQDHMEPHVARQFTLSDAGYDRSGTSALMTRKYVPFRIGDLNALGADRIRELETKTIATLKLPAKSISSITVGRGAMDPSPNGNVTIEIRAEDRSSGRAGRINYELDGSVIATYLPQ